MVKGGTGREMRDILPDTGLRGLGFLASNSFLPVSLFLVCVRTCWDSGHGIPSGFDIWGSECAFERKGHFSSSYGTYHDSSNSASCV